MRENYSYATLSTFVGRELGVGNWLTIDQDRINGFADCTGDHQWINVDAERCQRESPFGTTIAHGFLTLSLLARLIMDLGVIPGDVSRVINAGVDEVRFRAPVRSGARVRARAVLTAAQAKGEARQLVTTAATLEVETEGEGEAEPALTAVLKLMMFRGEIQ